MKHSRSPKHQSPTEHRGFLLAEQLFRLIILTSCLVVPLFMRGFGTDRYLIPKIALVVWLATVLAGHFVLRRLRGVRPGFDKKLLLPFVSFLFIASVSAMRSVNAAMSLEVLLLWFSAFVFYMTAAEILRYRAAWLCLSTIQLGATLSAVLYILSTTGMLKYPPLAGSTFGNKNFFSEYLVLTFPILAAMVVGARHTKGKGRRLMVLALALQATALVLGTSQGAWLGVLVALGLLAVGLKKLHGKVEKIKPALIGLGTILLLVVLVSAFSERVNLWSDINASLNPHNRNVRMRWLVWKASLDLMAENPIVGIGIGNYDEVFPLFRDPEEWAFTGQTTHANWAHNSLVHFGSEVGLAGLAALLWLIVASVRVGWGRLKEKNGLVQWSIAAAVGGMFVNSLVGTNFNLPANLFLFGICLGLLENRIGQTGPEAKKSPTHAYWLPVSIVAIPALALLGSVPLRPYIGDQLLADGIREYNNGKTFLAVKTIEESVDVYPHSKESRMHQAIIEQEQGNYNMAISLYREMAQLFPSDIRIHNNLGLAYEKNGQGNEAMQAYVRAVELNPTSLPTYESLGRTALAASKYAVALETFEKAIALGAKAFSTYISAADAAAGVKEFSKAAELYQKAVYMEPEHPNAWFNLGLYRQEAGEFEDAIGAYRQALSRSEMLAPAYNNIAKCYLSLQKPGGAISILEDALKKFPDSPDFHFNIAIVYNGIGQKEKASEHLAKAKQLAPERTDFEISGM